MILKPHSLNVGSLPRNGERPNTGAFYMTGCLHGARIRDGGAESGGLIGKKPFFLLGSSRAEALDPLCATPLNTESPCRQCCVVLSLPAWVEVTFKCKGMGFYFIFHP